MEWNTHNSNNEQGILKANGPYRLQTSGNSFGVRVQHPQVMNSNQQITIGEVRVYGIVKENQPEKKDSAATE
jgi:hypothetical protein